MSSDDEHTVVLEELTREIEATVTTIRSGTDHIEIVEAPGVVFCVVP